MNEWVAAIGTLWIGFVVTRFVCGMFGFDPLAIHIVITHEPEE